MWVSGDTALHIPNLRTQWGWVVISTYWPFYHRGSSSNSLWIKYWEGPRSGLDASQERRMFILCRESKHDTLISIPVARRSVTIPTTLLRIISDHVYRNVFIFCENVHKFSCAAMMCHIDITQTCPHNQPLNTK